MQNPLVSSVVCGGLEPLDSLTELSYFLGLFRSYSSDTIVIYTGQGRVEIPIFRPTLVREICRNEKVIEHIDNSEVIISGIVGIGTAFAAYV